MEVDEANQSDSASSELDEHSVYPLSEIQAHSDSVCSVSWHPADPEVYSSGGIDDIAFLYKPDGAKELPGHSDSIISVKFSPCGEYLATASMDSNVSVYLVSTGDLYHKYEGPTEEVLSISWHPRVLSLCILSSDLSLWIWHLKKQDPVAVIYGHPLSIAEFAPSRFIYAGGNDGTFKVWDMKAEGFESSPPYYTVPKGEIHEDEVISIDFHESGIALTGGRDGTVGLININSKRVLNKLKISEESVESVKFSREVLWFLIASVSGEFRVYECDTFSQRIQVNVGRSIVKALWDRFNVVVCGTEGILECYDGRTGELQRRYKGCKETILDIDVKHGKILAGSEDHKVFIWETFPSNGVSAEYTK